MPVTPDVAAVLTGFDAGFRMLDGSKLNQIAADLGLTLRFEPGWRMIDGTQLQVLARAIDAAFHTRFEPWYRLNDATELRMEGAASIAGLKETEIGEADEADESL